MVNHPDLASRGFPSLPKSDKFGATYTRLNYYPTWDQFWRVGDFADVVVNFDHSPAQLVFWRGTSYGPFWVTENNQWIGDQSNEDYLELNAGDRAEGCLEHMSDKQCRHSHVRIVENHDARVVIHWRYGLVDSRYLFSYKHDGLGTWSDEYWTIYPDGTAMRHLARGMVFGDGWVETLFLSPPGGTPDEQVELVAFTAIDETGRRRDLSWEGDSPEGVVEDHLISMVNSKSEYRMFNIYPVGSSIEVFGGHNRRSNFHWWNHWPVSQISSDGRGARAADRMAHSSLVWGAPSANYLMYGMTNQSAERLIDRARYWNQPPAVEVAGGAFEEFIQAENAFHLVAEAREMKIILEPQGGSAIVNPALVIKNWKAPNLTVSLNEQELGENQWRAGFRKNVKDQALVLWLELESTEKMTLTIKGN